MKHITDLTCCRALFAGWVFAYHLNLQAEYASFLGPVGTFVRHGSLGVDGFFILSGMILAHAHPTLAPSLNESKQFWAKRLVRIYPVHIVTIAALGAMIGAGAVFGLHPREPDRFGLDELLRHVALLHAWGFSDRWAWNYPSWSISAEWGGYLLFPFLWAMLRRQNGTGLAILLPFTFVGVVACQYLARSQDLSLTYDGGLLRLFPEFIAGMAIIPLLPLLPKGLSGRAVAGFGAVATVAGAIADLPSMTILGLWFALAGLMLAGEQGRPKLLGRVPGMRWLGEVSYSFYMSFALVETLQATIWRRLGVAAAQQPALYVLTTTALTLLVATTLWWWVERPSLRAFAAWSRRPRATVQYAVRRS
jgi:peptidoglycan/LPS O-acetylase OafA/YrhL